jgi:hypothetical protein
MSKIIYYYQTFIGLDDLLSKSTNVVTHIHLSSIHFGTDQNKPYIHLNDYSPDNHRFDSVWSDLEKCVSKDIKVVLMIGGAGGGYSSLFSDYDTYKDLLFNTIKQYNHIISGVDLDIEEFVDYDNVIQLIKDIKTEFGNDFSISMAPLQQSIETDSIGMGGFSYKKLYKSEVGKYIDYFCVQFYSCFSEMNFDNCVNNGYSPEMIVMGMLTGMDYDNIKHEVADTSKKYKEQFGGVFVWEYYDAPPKGSINPAYWSIDMYNQLFKAPSRDLKTRISLKIQKWLDKFMSY